MAGDTDIPPYRTGVDALKDGWRLIQAAPSAPTGEPPAGEQLQDAAIREFEEETGIKSRGPYVELGSITQKGGKVVYGWAFEGDHNSSQPIRSNLFEMQWPPGSGRNQSFPEVDRAEFFSLPEGKKKLRNTQWPLVDRLVSTLQPDARKD